MAEKVKVLSIGNRLVKNRNIYTVQERVEKKLDDVALFWSVSDFDAHVLKFFDMLQMWCRKILKADVVLIDVFSTRAFWFAWIFGLISSPFKARLILVLHGGNLPYRYNQNPKLVRMLFNSADELITPSNYLNNYFTQKGFRLKTILNSIDISEYPFIHRKVIRPACMAIRGFGKPYNPILTLRAFKIVLSSYPQAKLLLLGNPDEFYYEDVIRFIAINSLSDAVIVNNKLAREDWVKTSENFDIMISNPEIDNTPVSIIEGLALGMCIVSTKVGGIANLLHHEQNALLVESNDAIAISDAILELLAYGGLSSKLSENARKTAVKYDWNQVKNDWLKLFGIPC